MELGRVREHEPASKTGAATRAAVLVPILRTDPPRLLFTKRAEHLVEHPGQMSFPGGGREPADATLFETACREADEEIGLRRAELERVGRLDDITTVTSYAITPFVGRIPDRPYEPNDGEVAEIVVVAVDTLTDPDRYRRERRRHPDRGEIDVHYFDVDGYTIWGATGRILVQFLGLATDWAPPDDAIVDDGTPR